MGRGGRGGGRNEVNEAVFFVHWEQKKIVLTKGSHCMFNEAAVAIYSWMESLWVATYHNLACITFSTIKLPHSYNNQSLQKVFVYLIATLHSRVTVGGWSMEYKYKLLRQFVRFVAHRMFYLFVRHHCRATWRLKKIPVWHSWFAKLLGTRFASII